jgi:hypothetical protein
MKFTGSHRSGALGWLASALVLASLQGCETTPAGGTNKGTVSGAAGGATAQGNNAQLEKCAETLGTLAIQEDTSAPWYYSLREHQLGSTVPVLRLMVQQSNCFVIVERGRAMDNVMQERQLEASGEMRRNSNFGKGQMVSADYTMSPSIQFSGSTGGAAAGILGQAFGGLGALAGSVKRNEASTTLLLIDNRSGVQIAAAEGSARNFDFGLWGGAFGGFAAAGGGYATTPAGKIVVTAFADSFKQMVGSLRNYRAQTVKGGLGTGGRLGVDGGGAGTSASQGAEPVMPKPKYRKKK